jgi:threonine dehydratase
MPVVAPIMKVENCKKFGANVIVFGQDIGESRLRALEIGKAKGYMYINGYVNFCNWYTWLSRSGALPLGHA